VRSSLAILIALAALAACSADGNQPRPRSGAEAGLAALSAKKDMRGGRIDLEGSEATVVVVFASWCGPCRKELAALGELRKTRPKVRIIGLNAYEDWDDYSDEQKLRRFLDTNAPWLTVVRDDGTLLRTFGGVPKIPTVFVYDRDGRVVHEFRRNQRPPPDRRELAAAIDSAVERT
jgi:thiol-disulfide isomerase/thioredoxin